MSTLPQARTALHVIYAASLLLALCSCQSRPAQRTPRVVSTGVLVQQFSTKRGLQIVATTPTGDVIVHSWDQDLFIVRPDGSQRDLQQLLPEGHRAVIAVQASSDGGLWILGETPTKGSEIQHDPSLYFTPHPTTDTHADLIQGFDFGDRFVGSGRDGSVAWTAPNAAPVHYGIPGSASFFREAWLVAPRYVDSTLWGLQSARAVDAWQLGFVAKPGPSLVALSSDGQSRGTWPLANCIPKEPFDPTHPKLKWKLTSINFAPVGPDSAWLLLQQEFEIDLLHSKARLSVCLLSGTRSDIIYTLPTEPTWSTLGPQLVGATSKDVWLSVPGSIDVMPSTLRHIQVGQEPSPPILGLFEAFDKGALLFVRSTGSHANFFAVTSATEAPAPYGPSDEQTTRVLRFSRQGRAWATTPKGLRAQGTDGSWQNAVLPNHEHIELAPLPDDTGAWVVDPSGPPDKIGLFLIRNAEASEGFSQTPTVFDTNFLPTPQASAIHCSDKSQPKITLHGISDPLLGRVSMTLTRDTKTWFTSSLSLRDGATFPESVPCAPGQYSLTSRYSDDLGSSVTTTWTPVLIETPVLSQPWVWSLGAFVALVVATLIGAAVGKGRGSAGAWLPTAVAVSGAAAEFRLLADRLQLPLLGGLIAGTTLASTAIGWFRPEVARGLARIAPYNKAMPRLMTLGRMRARMYADYAARARAILTNQRHAANDEGYIPLPCRLNRDSMTPQPVQTIIETLSERSHVLIEGPGGAGKSALIREAVAMLLARFIETPAGPLPVFCPRMLDSVEETISSALGADAISLDAIRTQLDSGQFVLIIDGADESVWSGEMLGTLLRALPASMLLVASRPNASYRTAFATAQSHLLVEPVGLTADSVDMYVNTYIKQDSEAGRRASTPTADMLALCRVADPSGSSEVIGLAESDSEVHIYSPLLGTRSPGRQRDDHM